MTNDPSSERFEITRPVSVDDIDVMDHVNNIVYLRWVQEAATEHWLHSASAEEQQRLAWVVVRHEIDYTYSARRGDSVIIRTWVGTTVKNYFERHTEILRASDQRLLAKARTLWCPVDLRTGRPTRPGAEVVQRFSRSA
ncbi:MAG: acyl-CoA thioesterase [Bacteroidetes bacterium]|nr:acyl-CoA thioesterase [Bacteroidota bacterium]